MIVIPGVENVGNITAIVNIIIIEIITITVPIENTGYSIDEVVFLTM